MRFSRKLATSWMFPFWNMARWMARISGGLGNRILAILLRYNSLLSLFGTSRMRLKSSMAMVRSPK